MHTFNTVGREESQVPGLKGVLVGELGGPGLGLRFSSERRVVNLEAMGRDNSHVSRHSVTKLDLKDVSHAKFLSTDVEFLSTSDTEGILGRTGVVFIRCFSFKRYSYFQI